MMTVSVSPSNKRNTDHISLSDGTTTIGLVLCDRRGQADARGYMRRSIPRSAIKFTQGEQEYSDLEPPWVDIAQKDWSGGHGYDHFEDNRTGYFDGHGVDTIHGGRVILGPSVGYATGVRNWAGYWPVIFPYQSGYGYMPPLNAQINETTRYYAAKFVPSASFTATHIWFWARRTDVGTVLTVHIYSDSSGSPGASLGSGTITSADMGTDMWRVVRVSISSVALTAGTSYWVVIDRGAGAVKAHVLGSSNEPAGVLPIKKSSDGSSWTTITGPVYFRVTDAEKPYRAHFATLKNSLFAALEYLDYADSKVFINGTQGVATAGATTYLRDANNTAITDDRFNGGLIYLWDGRGSNTYRRIADTLTTNREIQPDTAFPVSPDTTTKYAVMDVDEFVEVSGLGAGSRVTDMLSLNGAIYVARGDGAVIRRLRHYYSGGSYFQWTDEGINATFLEAVNAQVWAANRSLPAQVRQATGLDCTGTGAVAALTFGSAINVGDMGVKITSILCAGEGFPRLFVFKEDNIFEIVQDVPYELRISALRNVRDGSNGQMSGVNDVYLFFSVGRSIQRYYKGQIDDISPRLPYDRGGYPVAMVAYPGRLYVAFDGGEQHYSTIQCWNGTGWNEVYCAPDRGMRILNLFIQPIPGAKNVDRLWFSCGSDICWMPLVDDALNFNDIAESPLPLEFAHHPYTVTPWGYIETGWIYSGLQDLRKLFNAVRVEGHRNTRDTSIGLGTWEVWYKVDDGDWVSVGKFEGTGVQDDKLLDTSHNLTGIRIKFRIGLDGTGVYNTVPVELNALILEMMETVPHRYALDLVFRVADRDRNLLGSTPKALGADAVLAKLREWANDAGTVTLKGYSSELGGDGRRVKLDPVGPQIIEYVQDEQRAVYICTMTVYEVE